MNKDIGPCLVHTVWVYQCMWCIEGGKYIMSYDINIIRWHLNEIYFKLHMNINLNFFFVILICLFAHCWWKCCIDAGSRGEDDILEAVIRWLSVDLDTRWQHHALLLHQIHMPSVSTDTLTKLLQSDLALRHPGEFVIQAGGRGGGGGRGGDGV